MDNTNQAKPRVISIDPFKSTDILLDDEGMDTGTTKHLEVLVDNQGPNIITAIQRIQVIDSVPYLDPTNYAGLGIAPGAQWRQSFTNVGDDVTRLIASAAGGTSVQVEARAIQR